VRGDDESIWSELYASYRAFYQVPEDPEAVATSWQWVSEGRHGIVGLVAEGESGAVVALANLRWFARPSTAAMGLYLDDLFTASAARGRGAAGALLQHAAEMAHAEDASVVRWITAADNQVARGVYDTFASATPWVTYDMKPVPPKD
jgi:GNAT superfamily N-acetyltransferase